MPSAETAVVAWPPGRARESVELLRRTPAYLNHGYRELLACLAAENEVDEASRVAEAAMLYLRQRPGTCYWDPV